MRIETLRRIFVIALLASIPFCAARTAVYSSSAIEQAKDSPPPRPVASIELLTPTEGVDFNGYLRNVYGTTKKGWLARMPASVAQGLKGVNSVEFRILQDGTVPKEFMKFKTRSGKADLDDASVAGIRDAAPFARLPADFTAPYIELRFTFYYNLEPPQR